MATSIAHTRPRRSHVHANAARESRILSSKISHERCPTPTYAPSLLPRRAGSNDVDTSRSLHLTSLYAEDVPIDGTGVKREPYDDDMTLNQPIPSAEVPPEGPLPLHQPRRTSTRNANRISKMDTRSPIATISPAFDHSSSALSGITRLTLRIGSETPPDASRSPSPIAQADYGTWRCLRPANFSPQPSVNESPRPTPPPPEQSTLSGYYEEYQSQSNGSTPRPVSASLRPGGPAPLLPVLVRPPSPCALPRWTAANQSFEANTLLHPSIASSRFHPPNDASGSGTSNANSSASNTEAISVSPAEEIDVKALFEKTMTLVRLLPSGTRVQNRIWLPFYKREGEVYICLLCPRTSPKMLANHTQIIQHVSGFHGETRPFACSYWCVFVLHMYFRYHFLMGRFDSKHRFVRKADAIKHEKDSHSGIVYKCSKWCAIIASFDTRPLINPAVVVNPSQISVTRRGMNNHVVRSAKYSASVVILFFGCVSGGLISFVLLISLSLIIR